MKKTMAACLIWTMIVGFWGMTYPEFCFTKDSIQIINPYTGLKIREFHSEQDFEKFLNCKKGDIVIKCRIAELWQQNQKRE